MKFEEINFDNKKIFIAPFNNLIKLDETRIEQHGYSVSGYIDNYKDGDNIVKPDTLEENSLVVIISPNHWQSILATLSDNAECYIKVDNNTYIKYVSSLSKPYIAYLFKKNILLRKVFNYQYKLQWFLYDKYNIAISKNIRQMKGLEKTSKRVFIIGNGPSLKIEDLDLLKDEITIASNKIFLAFNDTSWRPTYYTIVDPLDIEEYYHDIKKHNLGLKFFPDLFGIMKMKDSLYYRLLRAKTYKDIKCTGDMLKGFYGGESVSFSMIDFALSLGTKEIYLIGFDHNYSFPKGYEEKLYKVSEGESNHFHPDYRKKGDVWTEPRVDNITAQFQIIRDYCDENDVKIFNATRGGYLEVFERANFDELFQNS